MTITRTLHHTAADLPKMKDDRSRGSEPSPSAGPRTTYPSILCFVLGQKPRLETPLTVDAGQG